MSINLNRRSVLAGACSLAASPLVTPMAFAQMPSDNRLVVIILRGGMDGLDVLRPVGDPDLARLRPGWDLSQGPMLTAFHRMNPGLKDLLPLWDAEELAFAQAVSTPYRDGRSHFDGQDILEAGTPGIGAADGWLNRVIQGLPRATGTTAFAVGRTDMAILRGAAAHASWAPDARLDLPPATAALLDHIYHDDPLFRQAAMEALAFSDRSDSGGRGHKAVFEFAAAQLLQDTRIAAMSMGGWDTHRAQPRQLPRVLANLSEAILTLRDGLGAAWRTTTVLAMTEFGRTAAVNGSQGTDHGTGGLALLAGGAIRGGQIFGDWPGLNEAALYDRRDLMPTGDVRAYAAWALAGQFGLSRTALETVIFPGLSMLRDPGLLR